MTMQQVADRLNLHVKSYNNIEGGFRWLVDLEAWFALKDLYGWDIKEMLRMFHLMKYGA